jgi:HEAT repeat protein
MCVADLLSRLGNDAKSAIPDIINQIHIEKDDSVRQIELGYFEVPLQTMSEKEKASLFPELLRAMQSENSGVRNNALVALQFYPLEPVIPIMVGSLQDSDAYVRLNAARELNKLDPRSAAKADIVRVLADCSTNSDTDNEAVVALGDIHLEPEVAVPALIQCLQSSKAYVRANAAVALGRFGSQARPAMAALQRALDDSDDSVRRQATTALKRINSGIVPNQGFH